MGFLFKQFPRIFSLFMLTLFGISTSSHCASDAMPKMLNFRPLKIGILRHINITQAEQLGIDAYAERSLIRIACQRGHSIEFINPLTTLSTDGNMGYDVIISRVEVDAFADNLTDAYLRMLNYFEAHEIPVINDSSAVINAQDKFRTLVLAKKAGLLIPLTFTVYAEEEINKLLSVQSISFPFFVKKPYGGCGKEVFLVKSSQDLHATINQYFKNGEPVLAEERVDLETDLQGNVRDMRVWVVRDAITNKAKFVGGAYRTAAKGNYLTNICAGGSISPMLRPYPDDVISVAEKALNSINADVAGIDLARDKNGKLYLLEINIGFYTSLEFHQAIGVNVWEYVIDLAEARAWAK